MNKNIDLTEILKDCKTGTELYSSAFGELIFIKFTNGLYCPILCAKKNSKGGKGTLRYYFMKDGRYMPDGECIIFPSKDQRDWSKFAVSAKV